MPKIDNFIASIFLHLLVPLLPIFIEFALIRSVSSTSITLAASMYSIGVGLSSMFRAVFAAFLLVSLFFAVMFGITISDSSKFVYAQSFAATAITLVFLTHTMERGIRHLIKSERYFQFEQRLS